MKMHDQDKQPPSERPPRLGTLAILAIALLTTIGMAGLTTISAQEKKPGTERKNGEHERSGEDKQIHAKALDDHDCDETEWHFVVNQIDDEADAPESINVTWANGTEANVTLDKFTGKVAHYTTTLGLNSTVTNATAVIYEEWGGQFNLSHGPCDDVDRVPCPELSVTAEAGPANRLDWTAVEHADEYNVYRATDGENYTLLATVDDGTLSYEDTNVKQGQAYQYIVTAVIDDRESEACDPAEVTAVPVFSTTFAALAAGVLGIGGYALIQRRT